MGNPRLYFALIFIFLAQTILSQSITLRFQPERDRTLNYLILSEGVVTQSMAGMEQVVNSKTEAKYSYLVQGVSPNGDVEIIVSVDTIKTKVKVQAPALDTTIIVPAGFKFKQKLDKYGKTVAFEVIEMKGLQSPEMSEMNREIQKRNYSHTVVFPEKNISPGDKWDFSYVDSVSGEVEKLFTKTAGTYTFIGVEDKNGIRCAKLNLDANTSISGKGVIQGMNYGLEGEGKNVGVLWVDLKTGTLVHSETETEIEMAMGISGQVQLTVPITQRFKTIVSLLK